MVNNNTNSNSNNNSSSDNVNVDSLSPNEMKAYYRGLKRGIGLTFITINLREATMLNYARYPHLRFSRGAPLVVAQNIINNTYRGMNQPIPTPQEISLHDITTQEVGINILSILMSMGLNDNNKNDNNTPTNPGSKKAPKTKKQKIPYDKERAKKSGAFDWSKEQQKELR